MTVFTTLKISIEIGIKIYTTIYLTHKVIPIQLADFMHFASTFWNRMVQSSLFRGHGKNINVCAKNKDITCQVHLGRIISNHISISKQSRPWSGSSYKSCLFVICSVCKSVKILLMFYLKKRNSLACNMFVKLVDF